jgi:putative redox protein
MRIYVHFTVTGKALDPKRIEQAVKLSAEKTCSANSMLNRIAVITHDFETVEG